MSTNKRTVSELFKRAMTSQNTSECVLFLLEIYHPVLADTIRIVNNNEPVTSNLGDDEGPDYEYLPFPFFLNWPADKSDELPQVQLSIDNCSREIVTQLETIPNKPKPRCTMRVVLFSQPNVIEASFPFSLMDATYNLKLITGTLAGPQILQEPYPCRRYEPGKFDGLFTAK